MRNFIKGNKKNLLQKLIVLYLMFIIAHIIFVMCPPPIYPEGNFCAAAGNCAPLIREMKGS